MDATNDSEDSDNSEDGDEGDGYPDEEFEISSQDLLKPLIELPAFECPECGKAPDFGSGPKKGIDIQMDGDDLVLFIFAKCVGCGWSEARKITGESVDFETITV